MDINKIFNVIEKGDVADLHIYGVIGCNEQLYNEGTNNTGFALVSLLKRLDATAKRINIHINSPGGDIVDGLSIFNTIKSLKAETHSYNDGFVGSMAGIIALSTNTYHAPSTAIHHIHQPITVTIGNISEHEATVKELKVWQDVLILSLQQKTQMSAEDIQALWFDGKDHMLTIKEAFDYGIIDVIEESTQSQENKFANMNYAEIVTLFSKKKENPVARAIKNIFSNHQISNLKSNQTMGKFPLNKWAFLVLALVSAFPKDENNNVLVPDDTLSKLLDDHQKAIDNSVALQNEVSQRDLKISELNDVIAELKKKTETTAVPAATASGATDPVTTPVNYEELDSFTRNAILTAQNY